MTVAILTGCTGSGKTTIGRFVAMETGWKFIEEPVSSNPFLEESYMRPEIFGLRSQLSFMLGFLDAQLSWQGDVVQERCISDCLYVFARILKHQEAISLRDYRLLEQLHDRLVQLTPNPIDAFIFVECPGEVILERIARRGRDFEAHIDERFLRFQRALYEEWLDGVQIPVFRVSNEGSLSDVPEKAKAVATSLVSLRNAHKPAEIN
jgi:deoxyguanosine kinase